MDQLGFHFSDIEKIVLTHHHPDHYGISGWLQQQSGAAVWISQKGSEQIERLWGNHADLQAAQLALFKDEGMEPDKLQEMAEHMEHFLSYVKPESELSILPETGEILLGDQSYCIIHTPGHAMGHISFYQPDTYEIFCGDHVIARLTPNVSYLPGIDPDPLGSYLNSLEHMKKWKVNQAFSGHWHPFSAYTERISEIIEHHQQRLSWIETQLKTPATAYQLCQAMFGNRLSIHQLRFAMAEAVAHLVYLQQRDKLLRFVKNETWQWSCV